MLHQWTGRSEDSDVVGTDRSGLEYLSGSGVYLRAASGCARGGNRNHFVAGGQRGMGGTFPDFRKDCDAPVAKEYAPESGCDQDDRRTWNLAVHHAEYGKSCDDHAEYRTSENTAETLYVGSMSMLMSIMQLINNSGAGDYTGNPRFISIITAQEIRNCEG